MTIHELMEQAGCKKWPDRWEGLYDEAMAYFDRCGNPYTDPAFYRALNRRYGILNKHLELYCQAAEAIGRREVLSRFFYLLCVALRDGAHHSADMKAFAAPTSLQPDLAVDMLTALAVATEAPMCHRLLMQRKLPREHVERIMRSPEAGVDRYMARHNGRPGYDLLAWNQICIDGRLFRVGRLEIELFHGFGGRVQVFRHQNGECVLLAHQMQTPSGLLQVTETADAWEGILLDEKGAPTFRTLRLPKEQWRCILSRGDLTVSLHIPAGGGLTPRVVDETLAQIRVFLQTYFPDYRYKAFDCHSWLVDPQLPEILGADSNIGHFCRRFTPVFTPGNGEGVFDFVFPGCCTTDHPSLPETTSLQRALKAHYLRGNAIYETWGFFFDE